VPDDAWTGGSFGAVAECVLAPNASPMTLDGTNTWVLHDPSSSRSVVVDPGPLDDGHLSEVAARAGDVAVVLLTHHHLDHAESARAFGERVGCGVRALDTAYRLGDEGLVEGDVVAVGDLEVHVVATPGHTSDSLSFVVPGERTVLTGDTVLGRGTTVVAHPDGELGAYLGSLERLRALAEAHDIEAIWPGHGPVIDQALPVLDHYLRHRRVRLEQVREALRALHAAARDDVPLDHDTLPHRIVEIVYADVDPVLWPAAELSVLAQLDYLRRP
jgi:glyoxylase-like metal-dependent hydrolase (beta-lactamase superfamily II)